MKNIHFENLSDILNFSQWFIFFKHKRDKAIGENGMESRWTKNRDSPTSPEKWSIASNRIVWESDMQVFWQGIREGVQIQWKVGRFSCFSRANYYILLRTGWTGGAPFEEIRALLWRCWFRLLLHSNMTSLPEQVNISIWIWARYLRRGHLLDVFQEA